ncbi:bifunctional diguanylate cyclase/phosphodiesterase [Mycolicibacterium sp. F2034L]|uniref:putative bifunctional diguanylate cyclase/phosphodiesterase n=1 Tax=Mycolicibacterium sp. F2034L TaxID=2926422 RepID=UPI001FF29F5E|nr:EAL domain-containing protein [Mycolicibacterium sp. F2034L]MCK0175278.1 EAL domain-containing protein [Mycolicibacterium sp. F2034L]
MSGSRLRGSLFAVVAVVAVLNAMAPFGEDAARVFASALQACIGIGAIVTAAVVARRVAGPARWWRVLVISAMGCWVVGEAVWWSSGAAQHGGTAALPGTIAYFGPPALSLAAMIVLAVSSGALEQRPDRSSSYYRAVAVLDGVLAALAFTILVFISREGAVSGLALPHSRDAGVVVSYSVLQLSVVVAATLLAMAYRRDRPSRANFLLLSGGVLVIASSDRLMAYLLTLGLENADLWGGVGFTLGPLMIAYALLPLPRRERGRSGEAMDWVQAVLPYIGFLGTIVLLSFHLLGGRTMEPVVVLAGLGTIVLVTLRQIMAMRAQRTLTRRLFETQRRLAHQVHHDPLTGLPNRLLFGQRLDAAMRHGRFVLVFVDIDDFKDVNDKFGHAAGDELLSAVGARLGDCVRDTDTLARIGGDEFAVLVEGDPDAPRAETPEEIADRFRVALDPPFAVHGSSVRVRVSMGLVRPSADQPVDSSDELLRQADISMYAGKRLGKDTAVVYRPTGVTVDFPSALRRADGEAPAGFRLVYQPVVTLPDGDIVAVEALARWTAPNGMQIPPLTFVAMAEGSGLGADLDALVLDIACREVRALDADLAIHVNIGAARLGNRAFERQVARTVERYGVDPARLVLEITETVPIVDLTEGAAAIERLRALGVKIALDDFGAGFNSLTYLQVLPVDIIKLDRGLAVGAEPGRGIALYRSIISVCEAAGLDVIAEGIETAAQADAVLSAGCHQAQGYLFGRPLPLAEIPGLIGSDRRRNPR